MRYQGLVDQTNQAVPTIQQSLLKSTTTTDPTANWKTYTSDKYGYELKYPADLGGYVTSGDTTLTITSPGPSDVPLFKIDIYQSSLTPTDWWNQIGKTNYKEIFNASINSVEISGPNGELRGVKGLQVPGQRKTPGGATVAATLYIIPHSNNLFVFSDNTTKENNYDKILSTFKFTDQNQTSDSNNLNSYTNTLQNYSFSYPNTWQLLKSVPPEFQVAKSYVEGGNLNSYLSGKMLESNCSGPILQNINNPKLLIAFEIIPSSVTDGGYCWSNGTFLDNNKWIVTTDYEYPPGSGKVYTPDWKGDFVAMKHVVGNSKYSADTILVNRETFVFNGKDEFDQILSTFKFTQ